MKVAFYSAEDYVQKAFEANESVHSFHFIRERLDEETANLAAGFDALCVSPHDHVNERTLKILVKQNIALIIVRSSGFDNVNFKVAEKYKIPVKWLPGFAPHAIAEHAVALLLTLNRKIHLTYEKIMQGDFMIRGQMGFNLQGKTIGVIGMGRIGFTFAKIMLGFGCKVIAFDESKKNDYIHPGIVYVSLKELLQQSHIISMHCNLNEANTRIINQDTLKDVRPGAVIVNTARGKLVDTKAILEALKKDKLGGYAADVYESEQDIFHKKFSSLNKIKDPLLKELIRNPKVLFTPHQAFYTREAMKQMVQTVVNELTYFEGLNEPGQSLMI